MTAIELHLLHSPKANNKAEYVFPLPEGPCKAILIFALFREACNNSMLFKGFLS
jgi:hypothetical protein